MGEANGRKPRKFIPVGNDWQMVFTQEASGTSGGLGTNLS